MRVCPNCEKAMLALEYQNIEVDWCPLCKGLWLDQGELGLLMNGDPAIDAKLDLKKIARGKRRCPRCGHRMDEVESAEGRVTLDRCPYEHGLWFDAGEVQTLVSAIDPVGFVKFSDFCASLFGAASSS